MTEPFGSRFEKFVGVEKPPTLDVTTFQSAEFVASRVQWDMVPGGHLTQFDRADGYMICLQRSDIVNKVYWADDRPMPLASMPKGQFLLLDLNIKHSSVVASDVDCISIYASREALVRFQTEHDMPGNGHLHTPAATLHEDRVVRHLGEALLPAIHQPHTASQLYIDNVALALLSRLTEQHATNPTALPPIRGGLATWQERRAKEMLVAHIDGQVGLDALAAECRLSRAHFARAFKVSTGLSPLRWLNAQRVERAKTLLMTTDHTLDHVAGACGFADASHLTRAFMQDTGVPPGTWRRVRRL